MVANPETERQEARKAKRQLLFSVTVAIVVAGGGWYGFEMLSDSMIKAGLQPKSWARAAEERRKADLIEVQQDRDQTEAVPVAPVVPITPALPGQFVLPSADTLLSLAREHIAEHDIVTGGLLALAALPKNLDDLASETASAALSVLYDVYLKRREVSVLSGHGKFVRLAAFNAKGTMAVTASSDQTARLWDVSTGEEIAKLEGHDAEVWSAAFSPDGARVMTVSFDESARLWDVKTGGTIAVLKGHRGKVNVAAFSSDGRRMLTASYDNTARVWDVASAATLAVLEGHAALIRSAAFSSDSGRVVTASRDGTARIWDAETGAALVVLRGHTREVRVAAFSPDGSRVATASADGSARLWNATTGAMIAILSGHDRYVTAAFFSPDGRRVISAAWGDNTARLWDAETGAAVAVMAGHRGEVNGAAFSQDSRYIVTAGGDNTARVWDAVTGAPLSVLAGHANQVYTATFSPDGATILTASADGTARLWSAHDGVSATCLPVAEGSHLLQFNGPGQLVMSNETGEIEVWNLETSHRYKVDELEERAAAGVLSVAVDAHGTAQLVEKTNGKTIAVLPGKYEGRKSALVDPMGKTLATLTEDGVVRLYTIFPNLAELATHLESVLPRKLTRTQRMELTRVANTIR
jgi:WD40 repeat protein